MMKEKDYSILVVDDEPANVLLLTRMLQDSYRVRSALSGGEALAIAQSDDRPALILLDVMMPELDGFEVCRRLKDQPDTKDIMVIFVTAMGDSAAEEVGLNLGAVDYIAKPLRWPIVRARVRNHMNVRKKTDMLEAMSYIDGLTHAHNRRRFDMTLPVEWQRGRRTRRPLALVMIDFDHFKALNDHYGHGSGDICLQQGAAAMTSTLRRPGDLLARYGGEEFVVLLPDTDLEGARRRAEEMRLAVKALRLPHEYSSVADHVTISLGVASAVPDPIFEPLQLLELADQALNRAKAEGRDRVGVAPPLGTTRSIPAFADCTLVTTPEQQVAAHNAAPPSSCIPHPPPERAIASQYREAQTLMGVTVSNLEHLLDTPLTGEQRQCVETLRSSVAQLRNFLNSDALKTSVTLTPTGSNATATDDAPAEMLTPAGPAVPATEVRLLLVDDNRANRTVITAMLRKLGYQDIVAVGGGRSALEHLAQHAVDLVLTDCQMPDMNGMELVKRIRGGESQVCQRDVPVIALTGLTDDTAQQLCVQAGINGYLVKPVNLVDLAAMLTKHLGDLAAAQLVLEAPTPPLTVTTPPLAIPAPASDDMSPLFRSSELLERVGQDPDIACAVVGQFLSDVPMRIVELHTSLSIGDVERVKFLAHSIKGLAGTIAAPGLQSLAARLETGTQDTASDLTLAGELDAEYRRLARALRHSLQQWTKQRTE